MKGEDVEGKLCVLVLNLPSPFLKSCLRNFVGVAQKFFLGFQAQQPVLHGGLLQRSLSLLLKALFNPCEHTGRKGLAQ